MASFFDLTGKAVLITGGSRGLGLMIAREICSRGGRVALVARGAEELNAAVAELRAAGGEAVSIVADLTERDQIERAVAETTEKLGGLDVLINNAGMIEVGPLAHMQRADFEKSMALHYWAPFDLMNAVLPRMRERGGGRIANVASIGGLMAVPHLVPYCASKFALVGLSTGMRSELAAENIFVTTVTPGLMRTGSHVHAKFKGDHKAEFGWFSFAAQAPLISIPAERAAKKIVDGLCRGRALVIFPFVTRLAVIGNAIMPNLTAWINKMVNRFLPGRAGSDGDEIRSGQEAASGQRDG